MIESRGNLLAFGYAASWTSNSSFLTHIPDINATHLYQAASYSEMYRAHPSVFMVIDKRAQLTARLPIKAYRRDDKGRTEIRDSPYGRLLRRPHPKLDRVLWWKTVSSFYDLKGEVVIVKIRDRNGIPIELWPVNPSCVEIEVRGDELWYLVVTAAGVSTFHERDVIHHRTFNPDNPLRGMSALEPLRRTLENEESARIAQSSFWKNGARPGIALTHPKQLSTGAATRLKAQFDAAAGGAERTGVTVVLEEGMKPEVLSLSAEEAQYIQGRKLNREEVWGCYHVQPTALGDLEHATYSNVAENLRSVYRDTMPPHLQGFETVLEENLRPDFDPNGEIYAEFLLDEVLRGDFEQRAEANQKAINSGQRTPAEVRETENLPFIPGSDRLYVNAALVPLELAGMPRPRITAERADADAARARLEGMLSQAWRLLVQRQNEVLVQRVQRARRRSTTFDATTSAGELVDADYHNQLVGRYLVAPLSAAGARADTTIVELVTAAAAGITDELTATLDAAIAPSTDLVEVLEDLLTSIADRGDVWAAAALAAIEAQEDAA